MFLAVVATVLVGCAPSRIPVSELSGHEELNQRIGGKTGQVVLASGSVVQARDIRAGVDSVSWSDRWSGEKASVSMAEVRSVKVHKTARGALKGLLCGAGIGLAIATPMYLANRDEPYADFAFVIMPGIGAVVGILAGMITDGDVYLFGTPPNSYEASSRQ